MERPLADSRPIGPIATMGNSPHQDILITVDSFKGMPSVLESIADKVNSRTGLSITVDDMGVSVNSEGDMVVTIHTGGPDVTHEDLMTTQQIVEQETDSSKSSAIVRAKV